VININHQLERDVRDAYWSKSECLPTVNCNAANPDE
jgi:hypothetical protein